MSYFQIFKKQERELATLLREHGKVYLSTLQEDMIGHYDFMHGGKKVDVKALKKLNRFDGQPQEDIHYVELTNVRGDTGWLYGEADYFAFEAFKFWSFVEREALQAFVKEYCTETSPHKSMYKLFTREGKKDIITQVKMLDIMALSDIKPLWK